ncbi:MAG: class I SAM-dependent methyltransferase [Firmicutes bacterium]|nr:class I SAM-dependent methyltransferase [Bacillota bacterium]
MKDIIAEIVVGGIDERLCQQAEKEVVLLADCASKIQNGVIVEIGRRKGGSLLVLCSYSPTSKVYSIDSQATYDDSIIKLLEKHDIGKDRYELIVNHSQEIRTWAEPIDLLFIDGNHLYNAAYRDLETWIPRVKVGGFVIMHDICAGLHTKMPGPTEAITKYLSLGTSLKKINQVLTSLLLVKS